jgi:DNA-binding response OmpR family regulator
MQHSFKIYKQGVRTMGKKKVLIIDNDVDFIDQNKAVLEENGFEVISASGSREGIEKVSFEMPDIVLLELMLEKHDAGFDLVKAIKADPRYKGIPLLMVTSAAGETGCDFCQDLDGYWMKTDDFVNKPVTPEDLKKRINILLEKTGKA